METPSPSASNAPSPPKIQARTPKQASAESIPGALPRERRIRGGAFILAALMLVVGIAIGALGMRARYSSREVIAAINGQTINKEEFFLRLKQVAGSDGKPIGDRVLRSMVGEKLQDQFSEKQNARTSKEEVEKKYAELSKQPGFQAGLIKARMTPGMFQDSMRRNLDKITLLTKGINVTDAEVQAFYKKNTDPNNPKAQSSIYRPAAIQIAVIITKTQDKAREARTEIVNGASFKSVVRKYSQDTSRENDGVLPPILKGRTRFNQFKKGGRTMEDILFNMKAGDLSDPEEYAGAWWVINCLDKQPEQKKSFSEVEDEARMGAALAKVPPSKIKEVEEEFTKFQKEAKLQAFWPEYQDVVALGNASKK